MKNYKDPVIFIVEDEPAYTRLIEKTLISGGFRKIFIFHSGEDCLKEIMNLKPDIVFLDYELTGINGIEVMQKMKELNSNAEFIFLSGQTSVKVAVEALKQGAFDYIIKDEATRHNVIHLISKVILIGKLYHERKRLIFGKYTVIVFLIISWIIFFLLTFKVFG